MPSRSIKYPSYEDFLLLLFSILEEQMDIDPTDPLPDYRKENSEQLKKILSFMQQEEYYPTLANKAAYLFTSIITGHIYSNGNKRLALVSMIYFLIINDANLKTKSGELEGLAIFVADNKRNNEMGFNDLKAYVGDFVSKHSLSS